MSKPRILTLWLDTWYGRGTGMSSEQMMFGNGLFAQLGFEEYHIPMETFAGALPVGVFEAVFTVPYQKVFDLRAFGPVIAWMCDDVWRYESFGKPWAEVADLIVTTDPAAALAYGDKAILSNWACRPEWENLAHSIPQALSTGFQGQLYRDRRDRLSALERVLPVPLDVNDTAEAYLEPREYFEGIARNAFSLCLTGSSHGPAQMKSRLFEPQLFGSILVTEPVPGLETYWEPGVECLTFNDPEEARRRIGQLRESFAERMTMAGRARKRLLAEHTYQKRFAAVFDRLGVTVA